MSDIILLKLGEIVLKGLNRRTFEDKLLRIIRYSIADCGKFNTRIAQSTIYIIPEGSFDFDKALDKLRKIFGIVSIVLCKQTDKNIESIEKTAETYLYDKLVSAKTFKCNAKRSDKAFPMKSPEICATVGEYLLDKFPNLSVDVNNPDVTVNIEIRDFAAYVHSGRIHGAGGMPIGSNGKAMVLLSGGIDSPVAAYMTAKRGVELEAVHFYSHPYTSERAKEKVIKLARIVAQYAGSYKMHIVHFTNPQLEIYEKCPDDETTIIMRRVMMKVAERISEQRKCLALVTGESIGQVASQTIQALAVTDAATELPVIRPLIGMDKEEIVTIAHKIGTFNTSILPYEDCCTVFVPKHPKTKPKLQPILKSESVLDMEKIIEECVSNVETLVIKAEDL